MSVDVNIDYWITVGDWGKTLHATVFDSTRSRVDLTDTTSIVIRCARNIVSAPLFVGLCAANPNQDDPDVGGHKGELSYTFVDGDADTPGYYRAQFVMTFPDKRLTAPTNALVFEITAELLAS